MFAADGRVVLRGGLHSEVLVGRKLGVTPQIGHSREDTPRLGGDVVGRRRCPPARGMRYSVRTTPTTLPWTATFSAGTMIGDIVSLAG